MNHECYVDFSSGEPDVLYRGTPEAFYFREPVGAGDELTRIFLTTGY